MRRMMAVGLVGGAVVLTAVVVSRRRAALAPVAAGLPEWAPLRLADPPARVAGPGPRPAADPVAAAPPTAAPPPTASAPAPETAPTGTVTGATGHDPAGEDPAGEDPATDDPVGAPPATDAPVSAAPRWVPPDSDGNCPDSHPVKGNRPRRIYHVPGGRYYDSTQATRCFCTPADAEADGYRAAKR